MKIYKPIEPIKVTNDTTLDTLKIAVEYTKGGYNTKRGVYAWITPVQRGDTFERCILLGNRRESGFKVFLKEMGRKTPKLEQAICDKVAPLCDKIAEHYDRCEWQTIADILTSAVENV